MLKLIRSWCLVRLAMIADVDDCDLGTPLALEVLGQDAKMSKRSRLGSKRGSRAGSTKQVETGVHVDDDGCVHIKLTWTKTIYKVKLCPDGRKCALCPFKDCDDDPVSKANGITEQMWWGYSPHVTTGKTQNRHCGYCYKIFCSLHRHRLRVLAAWERELGADETQLNAHVQMVQVVIKRIIETGHNRSAHLDWSDIKKKSLTIVRSKELNVQRPGWYHVPMDKYLARNIPRETAQREGHREFTCEGVRGVLIPDGADTKIQFNDKLAMELSVQAGSSEDNIYYVHV